MKMPLSIISFLLLPALAAAEEPGQAVKKAANVITLGLKGGVSLPQLNSALGTTFAVNLEAAYFLPFWESRLGLLASLGYSQPTASGNGQDARLPEGEYSWSTTQRQTLLDIGLVLRVMGAESPWNVVLAAGPRIVFVSTLTSGEAGDEPFGEHDERATRPGVFVLAQGEYRLGPGAAFLEFSAGMAFEDLRTTGELTVAALQILAGYRFRFSF